ncbi:MAG: glycosyl transferase family 1 [Kordiimonadales bacterium]|nr:MAG: glycosyl transferase family 1 [Kordiimonadales bacterium]
MVIPKIGMLMTPNFLFRAALKCVQKLLTAGLEFDLIDAHYLYPDGVAASKLAGALEKPFVMTARGSDVTEIALLEKPKKAILTAISQASRTICVSENLRRDLIDLGAKPSQISTLRNGVDLDRFQIQQSTVSLQKKSAGPNKLWVMLYAGWLIPRKRLDLVLEVTKQIPNLKTIIVGDGPLKKHLEATTQKLGIADRVEFLGQKKPEEMASLYRSADILLLPSDREGWPNVLLEAMACGTPVVTRSVGAAPDLITDPVAGRVVDSDKSHDIAVAVRDLMTHYPLRADVRRFAENFGWRETSDAQNEIFTRAIRAFEAIKVKVKL